MKFTRIACAALAFSIGTGLWISQSTPVARAADIAPANSRQALSQVIHELDVDNIAIFKVIDYLRNVSGANIVVNWKILEAAGVARETPISLKVRELTLRKMLQLVLNQSSPNAPLTFGIDSNVIQITTQEDQDKQLLIKIYNVEDLVMVTSSNVQAPSLNLAANANNNSSMGNGGGYGSSGGSGNGNMGNSGYGNSNGGNGGLFGNTSSNNNNQNSAPKETSDQKGQALVDLIKAVIRPNIWSDAGGPASIKYFNGKLFVTAPVSVQEAIGGPVGDTSVRYGM